jgi:hypothetical protein
VHRTPIRHSKTSLLGTLIAVLAVGGVPMKKLTARVVEAPLCRRVSSLRQEPIVSFCALHCSVQPLAFLNRSDFQTQMSSKKLLQERFGFPIEREMALKALSVRKTCSGWSARSGLLHRVEP